MEERKEEDIHLASLQATTLTATDDIPQNQQKGL